MQLKADGVLGIAGCCIAVDITFYLDANDVISSNNELNNPTIYTELNGKIVLNAKETLSYYDFPKMYTDDINLTRAKLDFQCIPVHLVIEKERIHEALVSYFYDALEKKDAMGFRVYQATCSDLEGNKVNLNIDLSRSFAFFEV